MPDAVNFRHLNFNYQISSLWEKVAGDLNYLSNKSAIVVSKSSIFTGLAI